MFQDKIESLADHLWDNHIEALAETLNAGAYHNQSAVHNVFIGGDVMEDAMQEDRERCAAKSASIDFVKQDTAESMPDALKSYVGARNNMDLSSIVVTLMPSRSSVQYKSDVHRSVQVAMLRGFRR